MTRVYASLPPTRPGRDVLRGAELALERAGSGAPELVVCDRDARRAAEDPEALAYLGDFFSADVDASAAILGEAGLLQVAPLATWIELSGPTLVRISPHDGVGARAIADWLADTAGVTDLLLVHDHDYGYGIPVGALCAGAARERGLSVRTRPVWDHDEPFEDDLKGAQAVLYVGVAGSGAVDGWNAMHEAEPGLWLLGSEGVVADWLARELSPGAAERTRFFVAQRAPLGFYGYEAMALILDSLGSNRDETVHAARATRDRDSVIGRYSIDGDGHTTNPAYGRLAVAGGELVWD